MHLGFHARQHHHGLAEIDLHDPELPPFQLHEPVTGGTMFLTPLLHVTLHRGIRAGEPFLRDESVVHAFGGMALLAGHEPVACNHSSITGVNPSSFLGRVVDGLGLGEQSSIKAYFLTVSLDTFKSRAMARHGVPCWSRSLIRC